MKKLLAIALVLACLLSMAACVRIPPSTNVPTDPVTEPSTEPATEPAKDPVTEPTTEPATEPTEPPTQPHPETVEVYLLTEAQFLDNGHQEFSYDEDYNLAFANHWSMDGDLLYSTFYKDLDENGMPCRIETEWPEYSYSQAVAYFADGKRKEILEEGLNYTGFQYAYDEAGNMVEKRGYYDGILDSMVIMTYEGQVLVDCYCTDAEGNVLYDTVVENGLIMERNYQDSDYPYGYNYEYDENGNLIVEYYKEYGDAYQVSAYKYMVVQVSWERAQYLQQQQEQLKSIV